MPELAEVETIKNQLAKIIIGKKIKAIDVYLPKMVRTDLKMLKRNTAGAKITNVRRRAKLIIIELSNSFSLLIHLKLTGQLVFNGPKLKYTHIIYRFTDKTCLIHNDVRQFGYLKVISRQEVKDLLKAEKLGPEPLSSKFTLAELTKRLQSKPSSKIKMFLLDQKNIAGLGNIYTDEVLFAAKVLPARLVRTLAKEEINRIYKNIIIVLKKAIKYKGTSAAWYLDARGEKGSFQNILKVYQRTGKPCVICKTPIERIKMGSRSAHFCPKCQK